MRLKKEESLLPGSAIAAVDLGSNSFRLQLAKTAGRRFYPLETLKGMVRLGAGLQGDGSLDERTMAEGLACLQRFREHLQPLPWSSVRAVATHTLRVAKNARLFLAAAEAALGYPIEVISGEEEARLIYRGAAHSLPISAHKRLVVDIGGGSTECIIGIGFTPICLASSAIGCVSVTQRCCPGGFITLQGLEEGLRDARLVFNRIVAGFFAEGWAVAVGTSGTARVLADLLLANGLGDGTITATGLAALEQRVLAAGHIRALNLKGLLPTRSAVLVGGLIIMRALFLEFQLDAMQVANGALRDGILHSLLMPPYTVCKQ